jgi:hypothetical protein
VLQAALAEGDVLTKSAALQLAKWTRAIPDDYRTAAEEILVAAARAGADLRSLAAICAEIRYRSARPDPDDEDDKHLDRAVSLDTTFDGGCDQPAAGCEPHHVVHRKDGGRTSLTNLKDYCYWHHHVVLHELGWELTVHPDGTSQVTSPGGKIIRRHSPPPRPG